MTPTRFVNPIGSGYRVRRTDRDDAYLVHVNNQSDYLMHHGVKGQKWGVVTKEYEPVAVDHRQSRFRPVSNIRARVKERAAKDRAEVQQDRKDRQAILARRDERIKKAGIALGATALLLSLYGGYKLSGKTITKAKAQKSLKSLLNIIPKKKELPFIRNKMMRLGEAKSIESQGAVGKLKETFSRAGGILTGQRYKQKIQMAKNFIKQAGQYTTELIDERRKNRR